MSTAVAARRGLTATLTMLALLIGAVLTSQFGMVDARVRCCSTACTWPIRWQHS